MSRVAPAENQLIASSEASGGSGSGRNSGARDDASGTSDDMCRSASKCSTASSRRMLGEFNSILPRRSSRASTDSSNNSDAKKTRLELSSSLTGKLSNFENSFMTATRSVSSKLEQMNDEEATFNFRIIGIAVCIASFCGTAAWLLHMAVRRSGCLSGINGCHDQFLLDAVLDLGIPRAVYFTVMPGLAGLFCSYVIMHPFKKKTLVACAGGGSAGTKIAIAAGKQVSGWVVVFRIILCSVYMGGGNSLGTEGPMVHLGTAGATYLVGMSGITRRKFFSIFGVVGAAAGISAGFNVPVTGIVFVLEELTRTLTVKVSLMVALAAGWAVFVRGNLEYFLELVIEGEHSSMVPDSDAINSLTRVQLNLLLVLCIPIGSLNGFFGWTFCRSAWNLQKCLNPFLAGIEDKKKWYVKLVKKVPGHLHLAIIGIIVGLAGAVCYELTGFNGVWGTTVAQVPLAVKEGLAWHSLLILFAGKFTALTLCTGGGGPGGALVPSLVAGGFLGLAIGRMIGDDEALCSATAVLGMGSLFVSVTHLPVTGIVLILELTHAKYIMLHIAISIVISLTVCKNLPHGTHSYVHTVLERLPIWRKLDGQEFIEKDADEKRAERELGWGRLEQLMQSVFLRNIPHFLMKNMFESWRQVIRIESQHGKGYIRKMRKAASHEHVCDILIQNSKQGGKRVLLHMVFSRWLLWSFRSLLKQLGASQQPTRLISPGSQKMPTAERLWISPVSERQVSPEANQDDDPVSPKGCGRHILAMSPESDEDDDPVSPKGCGGAAGRKAAAIRQGSPEADEDDPLSARGAGGAARRKAKDVEAASQSIGAFLVSSPHDSKRSSNESTQVPDDKVMIEVQEPQGPEPQVIGNGHRVADQAPEAKVVDDQLNDSNPTCFITID